MVNLDGVSLLLSTDSKVRPLILVVNWSFSMALRQSGGMTANGYAASYAAESGFPRFVASPHIRDAVSRFRRGTPRLVDIACSHMP